MHTPSAVHINNPDTLLKQNIIYFQKFGVKFCLALTYPEASKSLVGFHAQMKTSDSCPRNTVALFVGISCPTSTSIASV